MVANTLAFRDWKMVANTLAFRDKEKKFYVKWLQTL